MDISKMTQKDVQALKDNYGTMDCSNTFGVEKVCVDGVEAKECVAFNIQLGWAIYYGEYSVSDAVHSTVEFIKEGKVTVHFKNGDIWGE